MEHNYWLGRKRSALNMAHNATASAEARLIHYELAGMYSIKAAQSSAPFLLSKSAPATAGERAALLTNNTALRPFDGGRRKKRT